AWNGGPSFPQRAPMSKANEPVTVASVDLQRYLGVWYEIARLPMRHEPESYTDITATYSLNPEGTGRVQNRARDKHGEPQESVGAAFVVTSRNNPSPTVSIHPRMLLRIPSPFGNTGAVRPGPLYRTTPARAPDEKLAKPMSRAPSAAA